DGIIAKDNSRAIASLTDWLEEGANPFEVYAGIINHLRALLFIKMNIKVITEIYSEKEIKHLKDQAEHYDFLDLIRLLQIGLDFESTFRQSINSRIALELLTLRFCFIEKSVDIADLIRQYEGVRDESRGSIIDIFIDKVKEQNTAVGCSLEKAKFNIVNQKDIELVFSVRDKFHYETISDKKNISLIERVYEELMKTKPRFKIKIAEQEVEAKDSKIEMIKNLFDGEELTR
ncbi:MAG: hypothetical protein ABIL05_02890, partial [candidate division WOR-3 bacterium]